MLDIDEGKDGILCGGSITFSEPSKVERPQVGNKVDCSFLLDESIGLHLCKSFDRDYEVPAGATFTLYQELSNTKLLVINESGIIAHIIDCGDYDESRIRSRLDKSTSSDDDYEKKN